MIATKFDSYGTAQALARLLFDELQIESTISPVAVSTLHNDEGIAFELCVHVTIDPPKARRVS